MKQIWVIPFGAFVGLAQAQSVDWNRAWSGCSAEAREFDTNAEGASTDSQGVKRWVENNTGSPSTNVAGLQRKLAEDRIHLSDSVSLIQLSANLAICGSTAALNQLQSGSTQSAAAKSPANNNTPLRDAPSHIQGCVKEDYATVSLSNVCNVSVNLAWCAQPNNASAYSNQPCDSQQFSSRELSPGESVKVDDDAVVGWFACQAPRRPGELKYIKGVGVQGRCLR